MFLQTIFMSVNPAWMSSNVSALPSVKLCFVPFDTEAQLDGDVTSKTVRFNFNFRHEKRNHNYVSQLHIVFKQQFLDYAAITDPI